MASRDGLRRELAQAEARLLAESGAPGRRLNRMNGRYWPSRRVIEVEERRILLLTGLTAAGRGHSFTPMTNWADRPSYSWSDSDIPVCRHCRVPVIGDLAARETCTGDQHACPLVVPAQRGRLVCGEPGEMNEGFTEWKCAAGHVTSSEHVPPFRDHARLCALSDTGCPWPYLAGTA